MDIEKIKQWRPHDWKGHELKWKQTAEECYEEGADAMLEALTTKPYKVIEWNCPVCGSERLVCDNCLVNRKHSPIPDEEKPDEH